MRVTSAGEFSVLYSMAIESGFYCDSYDTLLRADNAYLSCMARGKVDWYHIVVAAPGLLLRWPRTAREESRNRRKGHHHYHPIHVYLDVQCHESFSEDWIAVVQGRPAFAHLPVTMPRLKNNALFSMSLPSCTI